MSDIGAPGASQGGQGSGMGSGHGNADPDGPAFDPSAAPVGVNTDTNVDIDPGSTLSTGQLNHGVFDPGTVNTNFDPSAAPVGVNTNQTAVDVDYGYYDSPIENYSGQSIAMQDLSVDAWDNPNTHFSPMEFGPQHQMSLSTQQLGQNVTVGYGPQRTAQMDDIDAMMEQQERERTMSQLDAMMGQRERQRTMAHQAEVDAMLDDRERQRTMGQIDDAMDQMERERTMSQIDAMMDAGATLDDTDFDDDLGFATQTTAPTTAPAVDPVKQEMQFDFKNFYSALDDEDATEEAKALEVQGFLDHINRKNYTDTGLLSKLGIRSPQLTEREQIAQVKNFLGKHQESIDALNKAYSKQINENPGLRQVMPGYKAITGLMSLIGLEPQHVHPSVQALYDKMVDLGLMEKETPEMTEAKKIKQCNSTTGYRWDTEKNACVPINQDSDGSYNPYLGILG
jgi:hypothetical protein